MTSNPDYQPLDDFRRDAGLSVARLRATGGPLVLTVAGEPELVVLDAGAYRRLVEAATRPRSAAAPG